MWFRLLWCFAATAIACRCGSPDAGYVGRAVCSGCHAAIAASQAHTRMAQTWQGAVGPTLPPGYDKRFTETPEPAIEYRVRRAGEGLRYEVTPPGHNPVSAPVEAMVGGTRHGTSFLVRIPNVDGIPLERAPLVEMRYLHYAPKQQLALSPGFPPAKPSSYETSLGHVLSPEFEHKCLTCHGQPAAAQHKGPGVECESCHGPGQQHLVALGKGTPGKGILNPAKLPPAQQMESCARCHSGFSRAVDPVPSDLAISNQINAIRSSECFRQSGGAFSCLNCHNPHDDATRAAVVSRTENTCLACHTAATAAHAAVCPVNANTGCISCHMPEQHKGEFHMADHWIRVHTDTAVPANRNAPPSNLPLRHAFLQLIATPTRESAAAARDELRAGARFFDVARKYSKEEHALGGGYLGDLDADRFDEPWRSAALHLPPGGVSDIIDGNGRFYLIGRLPRDFRERALAHFERAMTLRDRRQPAESLSALNQALMEYPQFLRALTWLGVSFGEQGDGQRAAAILQYTTQLYPDDAGAHFNLAIAQESLSQLEAAERSYRRAIELEVDLVPAYLNLGGLYFNQQRYEEATNVYRQGIAVDPLSASLEHNLGLALQQQGKAEEAARALALAAKLGADVQTAQAR